MADNDSNGTVVDTPEALKAEREDFDKTIACVKQMARDFDALTEQRRSFDPKKIAFHLQLKGPQMRICVWKGILSPEAFQPYKESIARKKALGEQVLKDVATFSQALIHWEEDLVRRESACNANAEQQQQAPTSLSFSSIPILTGQTGMLTPGESGESAESAGPEEGCTHDNSGGNPGVLIYTSNWNTYKRYTTTQSKTGQLASAFIAYIGSSDDQYNMFIATDNPLNVWPTFNNVSYENRVIINENESWYYFSPINAKTKAEERAFIGISSYIPLMVGFSPTAGAGGDFLDAVSIATKDTTHSVDAGIQWGAGIQAQGEPWEDYLATILPAESRLPANFKTFDFFDRLTGVATSAKTLDTATAGKIINPRQIYTSITRNINAVANFSSASVGDTKVTANQIATRELQLAVPSSTTSEQWEQINAAVQYGKEHGVTVIVTQTK